MKDFAARSAKINADAKAKRESEDAKRAEAAQIKHTALVACLNEIDETYEAEMDALYAENLKGDAFEAKRNEIETKRRNAEKDALK